MEGTIPERKGYSTIMGAPPRKESATQLLVIMVTAPNQKEAVKIGKAVVRARLAACVNMVPVVQSIYRWQGKILKSQEVLLIFKSTKARYRVLEKAIKAIHSYDIPEIIAVPVTEGMPQYIGWVCDETNT